MGGGWGFYHCLIFLKYFVVRFSFCGNKIKKIKIKTRRLSHVINYIIIYGCKIFSSVFIYITICCKLLSWVYFIITPSQKWDKITFFLNLNFSYNKEPRLTVGVNLSYTKYKILIFQTKRCLDRLCWCSVHYKFTAELNFR